MVIHDLDLVGISFTPFEADAPLVVDPDAVLARAITAEFLEPIPRRDPKVLELVGRIQDQELTEGTALECGGPPAHRFAQEDAVGIPVPEALDHP
jgi:hypothetical protein